MGGNGLRATWLRYGQLPWRRKWRDEKELPGLLTQWAALLEAGLPVRETLCLLQVVGPSARQRELLERLKAVVDDGQPLAHAFQDTAGWLHLMLAAAEQSGRLPAVLRAWSSEASARCRWRQSMMGAALYPAFLLTLCAGLWEFVAAFVLPELTQIQRLHSPGERAWPVLQALLRWAPAGLSGGMAVTALVLAGIQRRVRRGAALPVWCGGTLLRLRRTSELCLPLSLLVQAGVPLTDALIALAGGQGPAWLRQRAAAIADQVLAGTRLSLAFAGDWDPALEVLVTLAEQTGDLASALERAGQYSQAQWQRGVERALQWVSPVCILIIGGVLLVTMMAVFLPLYDTMTSVSSLGKR
ncbi:MAG: type II secretion system F family protein [Alicyclobacillus sp.]|nr:type II secretion system F family protein [Alicyclobacillus sp.]